MIGISVNPCWAKIWLCHYNLAYQQAGLLANLLVTRLDGKRACSRSLLLIAVLAKDGQLSTVTCFGMLWLVQPQPQLFIYSVFQLVFKNNSALWIIDLNTAGLSSL